MSLLTTSKNLGDFLLLMLAVALNAATGGGTTSSYVSVLDEDGNGLIRAISFLWKSAAVAMPGTTVTLQLKQATSSGGAGAKNLGDAVTFTVPDDGLSPPTEHILRASVGAMLADLDHSNGFTYVALNVVGSAAVNGSVCALGSGLRANPAA